MTDHHPDARSVIANSVTNMAYQGYHANADDLLDALTAAGLAVVRVGDVPPWMEPAECDYANDTMWPCPDPCFAVAGDRRKRYVVKDTP
jgi:hypothetical protein